MQCRLRGPPSGVGLQVWVFGGGTYSHFFADLHVLEWTQPVTPAPEATAQLQMDLLGFWASGRGADVLVRSEDDGEQFLAHSGILCARCAATAESLA